ncbi:Metallo-dependent phosphatase-like protein [Mycena rebaudengoi]|nr:Metallo-dependent phosphatase-like protein [Mycena rebaudengoi]
MFARKSDRIVLTGLRLAWAALAVWYEQFVFLYSVHKCEWPDSGLQGGIRLPKTTHVLIVADPQILDHRSYPDRPAYLTYITQLLVDLNLRKSWRAALRTRPEVVVFLGDMMDGGRFSMSNAEYERYFQRFKSIFPLDPAIPQYFVPGNHDTGLGVSTRFSTKARARYISHFGPLNGKITVANHTIIFLDAPGIVEEDSQRAARRQSYSQWKPVSGGPIAFIQSLEKCCLSSTIYSFSDTQHPVVLFTHIPLSRPDGSSCGPNRERGTIRRGVGFGYQNTLGKTASDFLLENIRPSIVFSGDDHDYCEYTHSFDNDDVREVTVKSLSMAMGIREPGFQLLSLAPPQSPHGSLSHADSLCILPDQLGIYLSVYIPFLVFSLILIFSTNVHRIRSSRRVQRYDAPGSTTSPSHAPLTRRPRPRDDWLQYPSDDDGDTLPHPSGAKSTRPAYSRSFVLFGRRRRLTIGSESISSLGRTIVGCCGARDVPKSRGFVVGVLYDVRDVAVFPLTIFVAISLWTYR